MHTESHAKQTPVPVSKLEWENLHSLDTLRRARVLLGAQAPVTDAPKLEGRAMNHLVTVTQYSFWVTLCGTLAAAVFFALERPSLPARYRLLASIFAGVTLITAVVYYLMIQDVGSMTSSASLVEFPTQLRFIAWSLVMPLSLLVFPILLGDSDQLDALVLGAALVVLNGIMLVCSFCAEVSAHAFGTPSAPAWGLYVVGSIAWVLIVVMVFRVIGATSAELSAPARRSLERARWFLLVGWAVYPIGYAVSVFVPSADVQIGRELVYNLADLINQAVFGVIVWLSLRAPVD